MRQLRKAVRDYLTMRRGLGFKLVRPTADQLTATAIHHRLLGQP
jgi:hypothetical protein